MLNKTDFLDENLFQIIDFVSVNIYWKDTEGRYLTCNQYALKKFGLKDKKEVIGKTDDEVLSISKLEISQFVENDKFALKHGIFEGEEYATIDGQKVTYLSKKVAFLNEKGEVAGIMGTSLDITDQKKLLEIERKKIISGEQLKTLQIIDSVNAAIYWKDKQGRYLGANKYVLDMVGLSNRSQLIGKTDVDLIWKADAANIMKVDSDVINYGSYAGEEEGTLANGSKVIALTIKNQLKDSDGNVIGVIGTSLDITAQKEAESLKLEREKARIEEQLRITQIIDSVNAAIYWKDKQGRYLGANKYVLDMVGLSNRSQLIGKTDVDLIWKADAANIMKVDNDVINYGSYAGEEEGTLANGSKIIALTIKNQLKDSDGNVIGVIGTSLDITAQKEAEQLKLEVERERQQKEMLEVEKKSQQFVTEQQAKFREMVEKAVHDINSPLQLISTGINCCNGLMPDEQLTQLQKAYGNVLSILKDLAKNYKIKTDSLFSKSESRQDLLIMDFLADVLDEKKLQYLKHPISFEFSTTEAAKAAHIDAQSGRFRRALSNLLNNAIDALPKNSGVIKVALDASEESVFITICDNGHGMTPEAVQRILERVSFTENKTNGHGIGLQQVWEALEYNRGTMKIESTIGKGTSFILAFPRFQPTSWIAQEIVLYHDTILLILEDEKSFHVSWDIYLSSKIGRSRAAQIKYFCEGIEALNFVSALADDERKRVLLLADYELANQQLTGLDVIISSNMTNAILITGHANDAEIRHAALKQGITLLPKQLISDTPIRLVKDPLKVA